MGELLGLTWQRVHLGDDPHLYVAEQVYRGERKRLKTEGSERTVPLSSGMARDLTEWKAESDHAADTDPVFPTEVGTPMSYGNVYNRVLIPALKQGRHRPRARGRQVGQRGRRLPLIPQARRLGAIGAGGQVAGAGAEVARTLATSRRR